jgi:uncharacterized membrane protein
MLFYIPGYAFTAVLYPGKRDLGTGERAALSFGMSISLCPFIELVLTYTPWGLSLAPLIICLATFTLACLLVTNLRRHKLQEEDRYSIDIGKVYRSLRAIVRSDKTTYDRILTLLLVVSFVIAGFTVACVVILPRPAEKFKEFYVLGPNGTADGYPADLVYGDPVNVTIGIANHELRNVNYDLRALISDNDGQHLLYEENKIPLANNQSWRKPVSLVPEHSGTGMRLEFLLYIDGNWKNPYRECRFWVNISGPE